MSKYLQLQLFSASDPDVWSRRLAIARFLSDQPKDPLDMRTSQGPLVPSELAHLQAFAEKFTNERVIAWLAERDVDLEILVAASANMDRQEFAEHLAGDWLPEKKP